MRTKIFCGFFFFFWVASMPLVGYGNTNKEYFEELKKLAATERTNKNYVKALELMKEVVKAAEENNWIDLKIGAYNDMGVCYSDLFDYDMAMEYFLSAYNLALKESDKKRELLLLNNIAKIYSLNKENLKAKEYFEKSYDIAIYLNDSFRIGMLSFNLAAVLNEIGDFELAETYINSSLKILSNYENTQEYIHSQSVKVHNLYLQKKYNEAEQMGLLVWEQMQGIDYFSKSNFILTLSKIYHGKKEITKAIDYAHKALQENPPVENSIEIYGQLSDLYQLNGNYLLALQYKDSVMMLTDSLHKINNKDYLESNLIRFELINSEKALSENKEKQKAERMLFIVVIISVFALAMIFIWVLRIQSTRNKQRKIIAEKGQRIAELELEKEKNEKLLLKQQLKEKEIASLLEQEQSSNERKEKLLLKRRLKEQEVLALLEQERLNNENNQLAAKVLIQSNRNELIDEIISRLSKIPIQSEDSQLQLVIRQLKTQLKDSSELNNSIAYFDQINPSFLSSLKQKHPNLSVSDIRFLSYLFLNFNTKEIANLLNMSFDSCKKKRQRLASKMGVETAQLYNYLLSI